MTEQAKHLSRTAEIASKVTRVLQARLRLAHEHVVNRSLEALNQPGAERLAQPLSPWQAWMLGCQYAYDWGQRQVLFWDTLRRRGNQFLEHERAGKPPVLHFQYEMVLDARKFEHPVNYALVRIVPPAKVTIDPKRRPYIVLDPRAGHGPGIGGFKDDSQVGVALRAGHPVYFVIFYPQPEPGQTLLDVTAAEQKFVHQVRALHPHSPKPVLVGNCQGGWAAMMLAGADPKETGPVVINGAPMSYWGGAWSEGEGDNPMRYAGGLLGGTWLASFVADLGHGIFDGAWLVQNFENLNPANTFWDKYYHLFANVDTEPPRFLDFERWWGGMYLLNREEIEWIVQTLFVGNKLWSGQVRSKHGQPFNLRDIRSPIILFASAGDNITPPQQAFNWVADVYGSTEEIKAAGQVIVGLLHRDVGHLGIFVSGRVAKKEHAQIVSVLKSIEALPPGLYGMQIRDRTPADNGSKYNVEFVELRLEDITARLNRFKRADEQPFEAVQVLAEFTQRGYELFARPAVQALSTEWAAKLGRLFHPLRLQRWAVSDLNPWLMWLGPAAEMVKAQRRPLPADAPPRQWERVFSDLFSISLDAYREVRDALGEAVFFQTYGNLFSLYLAERFEAEQEQAPVEQRELPVVRAALGSVLKGGYAEAVARVSSLLARQDVPVSLERIDIKQEFAEAYPELLPQASWEDQRRIRGEQDIIVRYEPELALQTLPLLVPKAADRARLLQLLERLLADKRMAHFKPTAEQQAMLAQLRQLLGAKAPAPRARARRTVRPGRIPARVLERV